MGFELLLLCALIFIFLISFCGLIQKIKQSYERERLIAGKDVPFFLKLYCLFVSNQPYQHIVTKQQILVLVVLRNNLTYSYSRYIKIDYNWNLSWIEVLYYPFQKQKRTITQVKTILWHPKWTIMNWAISL